MTNMGCYAIDYALHVLGTPQRVEARWQKFWEPYRKADVENFGQILLDYDRFWGVLSVGKQMVQTEIGPRNALTIEFENRTIVLAMDSGFILVNGHPQPLEEYLCAHHCDSAIDQLLRCIEEGQLPESNIESAATGVEVLCAAYLSILENRPVPIPLEESRHPLFE